ncbi:MAG: penicillin-binding transpeptidase domain-containing protein, partial [Thermomicrobiales bacterium]
DEDDVIEIAGKTGTAEVGSPDEETNVYANQHAWFTCFAPFDDPEIVVTALVEYGGEGSNYAVPVVDQTLRAYFELSGRRKRGLVLGEDGKPEPDPDTKTELMPKPGSTVNPNRD